MMVLSSIYHWDMYIVLNQYEVSHVYLGDYLGNQKNFLE